MTLGTNLMAYDLTIHEDMKDGVNTIIGAYAEDVVKSIVDTSKAFTDTTAKWVDYEEKGSRSFLTSAAASGDTTINIDGGSTKFIVNNVTRLLFETGEIGLVTAGAGTNALTVARGQFGTSAAAQADGSDVLFLTVHGEGADVTRDDSQPGTPQYNYSHIIRRELRISNTAMKINSVGGLGGLDEQSKRKMADLFRELGQVAFSNIPRYTDSASLRTMGGLGYYATNVKPQNGATLTKAMIEGAIEELLSNGAKGDDLVAWCAVDQIAAVNGLKTNLVQSGGMGNSETVIRADLDVYGFSGANLKVIKNDFLRKGEIIIGQKSNFKVHPVKGRALQMELLGKTGDGQKALIVGEYSAYVHNGAKTFIRMTQLGRAQ